MNVHSQCYDIVKAHTHTQSNTNTKSKSQKEICRTIDFHINNPSHSLFSSFDNSDSRTFSNSHTRICISRMPHKHTSICAPRLHAHYFRFGVVTRVLNVQTYFSIRHTHTHTHAVPTKNRATRARFPMLDVYHKVLAKTRAADRMKLRACIEFLFAQKNDTK